MRYQGISGDLEYQLATLKERHRFVDKILDIVLRLNDFSSVTGVTVSPEEVLEETLRRLKGLFQCSSAGFFLIDSDASFNLSSHEGDPSILEKEKAILVGDGSFAWALHRNKPTLIRSSDGKNTVLLHSMTTSSRTMGMFLGIISSEKGTLLDSHLYFVTVVLNSAASVLQYLELFSMVKGLNNSLERKVDQLTKSERELTVYKDKLERLVDLRTAELGEANSRLSRSLLGVVDAMGKVVESRDPYTAGHQRRVASIASTIARRLGLSEDDVEGVRIAGLVHDIGKIAIPAEILTKPARLNKLEFRMVQTHPDAGYDMLQSIDFPWPVAEMVRQHHERMDGSGYPRGIKGDEILIGARCLAVADVVEAISSHRPYRPGLGLEEARLELETNRGTIYDPQVVDVCISMMDEGDFMEIYLS
ncbi:MAG: HD-GYP domain-containing protein [Dethiosulfovibrio sp.]|nr:HD-GYP domain-containing protein [Dethiosulfovibrio sp.]